MAATGGFGELDPFNAGEALVNGFEFLLRNNLIENDKIKIPLSFSYTLTNAKFLSDFGSTQDIWGEVRDGDRIPYIPQHQFNSSFSLQTKNYEINISGNYNGKFSTIANGSSQIPSYLIFDLSFRYNLRSDLIFRSKIVNMYNYL